MTARARLAALATHRLSAAKGCSSDRAEVVRAGLAPADDHRGAWALRTEAGAHEGRRRGDTAPLRRVRRRRDRNQHMILAHLDLDAFFAAVEELEAPELKTKPLVVGGDPHGRGVVATANYVARRYGIHSAMSCAEALRRCPQAVFLRPRHRLYKEYSRAVWDSVREVVPTVERTGMDEGYLDVGEGAPDFARARVVP